MIKVKPVISKKMTKRNYRYLDEQQAFTKRWALGEQVKFKRRVKKRNNTL